MLDARPRNADSIAFLERVLADEVGRHLAAQDHHRHRVHVRSGDTRHGVGDAWTGGHQTHARLLARACEAVGRVHRSLFVTNEDVLDLVLFEDFVVDEEDRAARIAEKILDPLFLKAAHYDFSAGKFHE